MPSRQYRYILSWPIEQPATTISVHWKPKVIMMPTLSPLTAPLVVVITTGDTTIDDWVGIMTTPSFQYYARENTGAPTVKNKWLSHDHLHLGCNRFHNSWWRHQIETFSALLALCAGNSPVTGEFPTQRPVRRSFDVFLFFFICAWINGSVNNR